ncbi:MAG TPA: serine hydrolase domain-containing protein [Gemmatimonadaceae bacterium]|nr:serine hydrolase domain-containing protein [Gemmatimonadaceae bacterium]
MHRSRSAAFAAIALVLASPLSAQSRRPNATSSGFSPSDWSAFTKTFDAYADSDGIVGAAVLFVRHGRTIAHHEFGFADRASRKPITERSIFHYGSITKTLTAISIMQLRDRGLVSLDDPIVRWVPELRQVHDPYGAIDSVTIRMLLSHSAGFMNPTWPYTDDKPWQPFEPTTWNQLVAMMPYQEVLFTPGSRYSYSNPGFIYLARVIEQLSGDPWETYVQKHIFAPLGLTESYFGVTPPYLAADRSHNYYIRLDSATGADRLIDNGVDFDPGITIPNGGWNAPLSEIGTYLAFLTDAYGADTALRDRFDIVLPHRDFAEMWTPGHPTNSAGEAHGSPDEWMGLSFFVLKRGGTTFVGHTGEQAGFTSFMYLNPATSDGVIAAFNTLRYVPRTPAGTAAFQAIREAALELMR